MAKGGKRNQGANGAVYFLADAAGRKRMKCKPLSNIHRGDYVIARVVYETSVNACFILAAGDEMAERAWRHLKQKSIRDLDRDFYIADER